MQLEQVFLHSRWCRTDISLLLLIWRQYSWKWPQFDRFRSLALYPRYQRQPKNSQFCSFTGRKRVLNSLIGVAPSLRFKDRQPVMVQFKETVRLKRKILLWNILKFNLILWCKAEFSASLVKSSASHDPSEIILILLICCLTLWYCSFGSQTFIYIP